MNYFKSLMCFACLAVVMMAATAWGQESLNERDPQTEPPVPEFLTFTANTRYTLGQVRMIYLADSPNAYFALENMPEGLAYFRIKMNDEMAAVKMRLVEKAAEQGWQLGVYHQRRRTENLIDADYLVALIPPKQPGGR